MNIIRFISRRYLFSKKHVSLISVLTGISIGGITIGTALLIIILSVFNGFFDVIRGYLLSFDPDIRVESAEGNSMLLDSELMNRLQNLEEVVTVAPYIEGKVMLALRNGSNEVISVRGIHPESNPVFLELHGERSGQDYGLAVRDGKPGTVVSEVLVNRYRLEPGDEFALLSPTGMRRALTQFTSPRVSRFEVRGSYDMHQLVEGEIVYIDLRAAQRLFNMRNRITGLDIRLTDTDLAEEVRSEVSAILGSGYTVETWYELQKPLYDVMYLEKWGSYFILMIIVLVAVLNIVGSLTMIVIQKKRDIGVLISMGMTPKKIRKIFMSQGFQIGLIGCGLGGVTGILLSLAQKEFGLVKLSSSFIIDAYPVSIAATDLLLVLIGTMTLCLLASWYPAARAAAVEPADAVRDE